MYALTLQPLIYLSIIYEIGILSLIQRRHF